MHHCESCKQSLPEMMFYRQTESGKLFGNCKQCIKQKKIEKAAESNSDMIGLYVSAKKLGHSVLVSGWCVSDHQLIGNSGMIYQTNGKMEPLANPPGKTYNASEAIREFKPDKLANSA